MKAFWVFMLAVDLLIPLTMIGFGKRFMGSAPKPINGLFGYRTMMSMKNRDTWVFAHRYFGRLWLIWGLALLPVTVLPLFWVWNRSVDVVGLVGGTVCLVQMIAMTVPVFLTEKTLKKKFDRNGNPL